MINFRYHVVTLVAVFLALGLGVLFGASFIDQKTVSGLQRAQQRLGERNQRLRNEVISLQTSQETLRSFVSSSRDLLIRNALQHRPVVVLTFGTAEDGLAHGVEDSLVKAGGRLLGSVNISERLELRTQQDRRTVAAALGMAGEDDDVIQRVVSGLTDTLSGRERGYVQRLIDAELASVVQPSGSQAQPPAELAEAGTAVVIIPPGQAPGQRTLALPLVRSLAAASVPVAVAQGEGAPMALLRSIRGDEGLRAVTVDHAEQPMGQAALALGLQAALAGNFGHYGMEEGATALLPPPDNLAA